MENATTATSRQPRTNSIELEVVAGLQQQPKHLPCKFFYDQRGSQLFDRICELDEYYLTRTELEIMQRFGGEIAQQIGAGAVLIEFGSGSSIKTRILLDQLADPVAYVPVDISKKHLHRTSERLEGTYPQVPIRPVCADFTDQFELPEMATEPHRRAVYLPGSTIGNFSNPLARQMLRRIAEICGKGGCLIVGIDLQKDVDTIEQAYNDSDGITAEFNLNLLRHINREAGADFDLDSFAHDAIYDRRHHRMEISLVSLCDQTVTIGGEEFKLAEGEAIRTEFCHKYTVDGFSQLAKAGGLELQQTWTDSRSAFAVLYYVVAYE